MKPEGRTEGVFRNLSEGYVRLLPTLRRIVWHLETEIRYWTLPILNHLEHHEQLLIKSRVKDCESAIKKVLDREGNMPDPDRLEEYTLRSLRDLVGVRVLVFPSEKLGQVDALLRKSEPFQAWTPDPITYARGFLRAPSYYGLCAAVSPDIYAEYQVVPALIGHFWEVEHSAMYKPAGSAKGADKDHNLKTLRAKVECSLTRFERGFERFAKGNF